MKLSTTPGFSLLELIVSVAIILVLTGGVLTNYNRYNEDQRIKQAALTLKANLRLAQTKALAGLKPETGCTTLAGYAVSFSSSSYSIQARCGTSLVGASIDIDLPSGISFAPVPSTLVFASVTGTVNISTPTSMSLSGPGRTYTIQISPNGDINELGYQ